MHDGSNNVTYLGLLLYTFFVLLPIVPAYLIFSKFPDTQVAVSGPFQQLTVRATGAFAAYLITLAAGHFIIQGVQQSLRDQEQGVSEWTVSAPLTRTVGGKAEKLVDAHIQAVTFEPARQPYVVGEELRLKIYRSSLDVWPVVHVSVDGYEPGLIDLQKLAQDKAFKEIGPGPRSLQLNHALLLREVAKEFKDSAYADSTPLAPVDSPAVSSGK